MKKISLVFLVLALVFTTVSCEKNNGSNLPDLPPTGDPLPGEFSVSATKKIRFSRGNLIATIDASGNPTAWRFARNQYDAIEDSGVNDKIGKEAGDIDLFAWSTTASNFGVKPYCKPASIDGDFVDWGTLFKDSSSGNGSKINWRTFTMDEAMYLVSEGYFDNEIRRGLYASAVTVMGVQGCLILYPDGYAGVKVKSGDASSYASQEKWQAAQDAGVVCFPPTGIREGELASLEGGSYWESSRNSDSYQAYTLSFTPVAEYAPNPAYGKNISIGQAVRLVTDVSN